MPNLLAGNTGPVHPVHGNKLKMLGRWSIRALLLLLLIVLVLTGLFLVINWKDETLTDQAQVLLQERTVQLPDAQNGFYILKMMDAPADTDVFKAGVEKTNAERALYLKNRATYQSLQNTTPQQGIKFSWDQRNCQRAVNCVQDTLAHRGELSEQMKNNHLLLQRYEQMQTMGGFEERLLPSINADFPLYGLLLKAMEMQTAQAVFDIADGKLETGLQVLENNQRYARLVLKNSYLMYSKMVAMTGLRKQVRTVSELATLYPALLAQYPERMKQLASPMSDAERSLSAAFAHEALAGMHFNLDLRDSNQSAQVADAGDVSWPVHSSLKYSYQPNATNNLLAQYWDILINTAKQQTPDMAAMKKQLAELETHRLGSGIFSFHHYVYNPTGKMLVQAGIPGFYTPYLEKSIDTVGYMRLVALQLEILEKKIPEADISRFVANAHQAYRNPHDGSAMIWDASKRQLQFAGHEKDTGNPDGGKIYVIPMI
ncbi:hypothetical protein [Undibacterium sp. YM2]|uniref:hypothetical protein n=1 Tax=Undibacterium sp. YM2 TaxID=2058625 RepID=UPI00138A4285|nr:hypothetical protein [Undibacterium sp. YM2]